MNFVLSRIRSKPGLSAATVGIVLFVLRSFGVEITLDQGLAVAGVAGVAVAWIDPLAPVPPVPARKSQS